MTPRPTSINKDAAAAIQLLTDASNKQLQLIADAALNATKLLAVQAQDAEKVKNIKGVDDHDFLLTFSAEVKTKLDAISNDIKELKDGTAIKIADHELRLTSLETEKTKTTTMIVIAGAILTFLVGLLVFHLFQSGV